MIGYIKVALEDGRKGLIRADEIGTVYESVVHPKPTKGQPSKPVRVITLLLRHGNKVHIRDETIETLWNKMMQALGVSSIHVVDKAVFDDEQDAA